MKNNKLKIKRWLFVGITAGMFLLISFGTVGASSITEDKVFELVNKERIAQNLPGLVKNDYLTKAAEEKAEDMLKNGYFAHTSPAGITPWHWLEKNGYIYKYAGENLAMNFTDAENQNQAWMESRTHRENILNKNYQEIGIAVKKGRIKEHEAVFTVQEFGTRADFVPIRLEKKNDSTNIKVELPKEINAEKNSVLAWEFLPAAIDFRDGKPTYFKFGILTGIGIITVFNFVILLCLAMRIKRKLLQNNKRQILCVISMEEYEDLVRNFKVHARKTYEIHFEKFGLKSQGNKTF
jgi:hypothetical protein